MAAPVISFHLSTSRGPQSDAPVQTQTWQNRTVCSRITDAIKAVALGVSSIALSAIMAVGSVFLTLTLAVIQPLTLIGTIPFSFWLLSDTVEASTQLLNRSGAAWNRAFAA